MLPSVLVSPYKRLLPFLALALACVEPLGAASFPPSYRFRTLRGARATIHFHQGLEATAREAVAMADEIIAAHEARYAYRLGRVQIVLADDEDDPNGFSTPLPYPMVHLRAAAPDGSDEFGNLESWLRLLLTHELAHNIHLDQARGLFRIGRHLFGRAPFLFPNGVSPQWLIEGLATYEETEKTAFGRGRNADSLMVRRMAALRDEYPRDDEAATGLDRWPLGQAQYLFGEAFLRDLSVRFGEDTLPKIARVHAGWPLPFFDELTGLRVTGKNFHARWNEFVHAEKEQFQAEARRLEALGLTPTEPLTDRGVRQIGGRPSPDGATIAYTSSTLTRRRVIRLRTRADGRERRLVERNGGAALSWTPDGGSIVYDDLEVHRLFTNRYDIRIAEVATGKTRWLTRGARARDPEVSPDGRRIAFVRRHPDRSELAMVGLDGRGLRDVTRSEPGVQWSGPTWHPQGDALVVSRWRPGGWCDLVRVDPETGDVVEIAPPDRAREVEPAFTPDGAFLVFRSDRDGISNIYARRESDGTRLRVTRVLGGAFTPSVATDGTLVFSGYDAKGYDLQAAAIDWDSLPEAEAFADGYPPAFPDVVPSTAAAKPYRAWSTLAPRFWTPYVTRGDEIRLGAATGGADPLFRHAWGIEAYRAMESRRFGGTAFYRNDRFHPELLLLVHQDIDSTPEGLLRTQEANLRATLPVWRTRRSSHQVSLAWRRSREEALSGRPSALDLGGLELAWTWARDLQQSSYSISPSHGERLRLALLKEDGVLGSDISLVKAVADARAYRRVLGDTDVLAVRIGGGTTVGRPTFERSYAVGGFPDGGLFDLVRTNHSVLRGYPSDAFTGRRFAHANVEYRVPLAHPQRGFWSLPFFLRHLHATAFADAAHAWTGPFDRRDVKTAAGAALGADLYLSHALPLTVSAGAAHGFAEGGGTRGYLRFGLAF